MDTLAALRLQLEWGADEALADEPTARWRTGAPAPAAAPVSAQGQVRMPSPLSPPAPSLPAAAAGTPAERAQAVAAACRTRAELRAALEAFDGCPLRDTATNLVFDDGDPDATLLLVSDVPGAEEDRTGRPFAGRDGELLGRMLASIGLDRGAACAIPILPWRPPGGRPPTDGEMALCLPFLLRYLALAHPRHVVLFGQQAAKALLPRPQGRGLRGAPAKWAEITVPGLEPAPALALPAPSAVARTALARRQAWDGLRALRRRLDAEASR